MFKLSYQQAKDAITYGELHKQIAEFFKANPNPSDEEVHEFAKSIGQEPDEIEENIYNMLTQELLKDTVEKVASNNQLFEDLKLWQELEYKWNYLKNKVSTDEGKTEAFEIEENLKEVQNKIIAVMLKTFKDWYKSHDLSSTIENYENILAKNFDKVNFYQVMPSIKILFESYSNLKLPNIPSQNYTFWFDFLKENFEQLDKEEIQLQIENWEDELETHHVFDNMREAISLLEEAKTTNEKNVAISLGLNTAHFGDKNFLRYYWDVTGEQLTQLSNLDTSKWEKELGRYAALNYTDLLYKYFEQYYDPNNEKESLTLIVEKALSELGSKDHQLRKKLYYILRNDFVVPYKEVVEESSRFIQEENPQYTPEVEE